jgi:hypothetical protein
MCKRGEERAEEERVDAWLFIDGPTKHKFRAGKRREEQK